MTTHDNSYKGILRNMSVFGGVQVLQIVAGLLRGKIAAIFLGPAGMGISALFTASSTTLQQLSSLGLQQSIVRETAAVEDKIEHEPSDDESDRPHTQASAHTTELNRVIAASRFLLTLTALIGAIICLALSTPLSHWSFGSGEYIGGFMLLSVMVFFTTLANGELAILQGLHRVRRIATATIGALLIGLLSILPFYWFMGTSGIVPAMGVNAVATFLFYRYCSGREVRVTDAPPVWRSLSTYRSIIWRMVSLGVVLMAAQLLGSLSTYLLNAFVRYAGSTSDVGLHQSANSLTTQCVTLVFAAMAMEFFPRLTTVATDSAKTSLMVNRQIEVVSLVAAPIAALMILFAPLAVRIVLSEEFLTSVPLIRWMSLGILFKAIAYPPGYISFAKGDRLTFFLVEGVAGNLLMVGLSIICYHLWGLIGLGVASSATFLLFIGVYIVMTGRLYGYRPTRNVVVISLSLIAMLGCCFAASMLTSEAVSVATMALITVCISLYSFFNLRRLMSRRS